ncbi:MAG: hypothetical protein ACK5W9_04915, partial [Bdellovibrionales bacterium]
SVHTIKGRLKGKDCRVELALYKKIPYPVLSRSLWKEMLEGVGIIWPTQKDSYDTKRANYLLVPACY